MGPLRGAVNAKTCILGRGGTLFSFLLSRARPPDQQFRILLPHVRSYQLRGCVLSGVSRTGNGVCGCGLHNRCRIAIPIALCASVVIRNSTENDILGSSRGPICASHYERVCLVDRKQQRQKASDNGARSLQVEGWASRRHYSLDVCALDKDNTADMFGLRPRRRDRSVALHWGDRRRWW
ncbi:hypothetical protein BKA93DRAFT_798552 [Sparassis latifolia]